jgi:hypothetical protein
VALPATAIIQAFISTYVEQHHVDEAHLGASSEQPPDGAGTDTGETVGSDTSP